MPLLSIHNTQFIPDMFNWCSNGKCDGNCTQAQYGTLKNTIDVVSVYHCASETSEQHEELLFVILYLCVL